MHLGEWEGKIDPGVDMMEELSQVWFESLLFFYQHYAPGQVPSLFLSMKQGNHI